MALSLTPQAMYNQFKKQSAGSVSELYYIYRKTRTLGPMSEDVYLVPCPRYDFRFEAVSRL